MCVRVRVHVCARVRAHVYMYVCACVRVQLGKKLKPRGN